MECLSIFGDLLTIQKELAQLEAQMADAGLGASVH
jgi:hypothetical protein